MRFLYFFFLLNLLVACKTASKKTTYILECQELIFDLSDGTLNGVKPTISQTEIKEWLPCYTQYIPDGNEAGCGGAILYSKHDFYFYTYLYNYIEVRSGFKGKVSDSLLYQPREKVREILGQPVENNYSREDSLVDFFPREYGCIRIHYKDNRAISIAAHREDCKTVEWCQE